MNRLFQVASLITFLVFGIANAATNVSNSVQGDQVWTKDGSPYIIKGRVDFGGDLEIQKGVEIVFDSDPKLPSSAGYGKLVFSNGTVQSLGTEEEPVKFLVAKNENYAYLIFGYGSSADMRYTEMEGYVRTSCGAGSVDLLFRNSKIGMFPIETTMGPCGNIKIVDSYLSSLWSPYHAPKSIVIENSVVREFSQDPTLKRWQAGELGITRSKIQSLISVPTNGLTLRENEIKWLSINLEEGRSPNVDVQYNSFLGEFRWGTNRSIDGLSVVIQNNNLNQVFSWGSYCGVVSFRGNYWGKGMAEEFDRVGTDANIYQIRDKWDIPQWSCSIVDYSDWLREPVGPN
jgi:hypothetical protein